SWSSVGMAEAKSNRRAYPCRWGADFLGNGGVRFKIWAPAFSTLSVQVAGSLYAMERGKDGWFELLVNGIAPGSPYNFVLPDGRALPDPASRAQASDVHGPSVVIDPTAYRWQNTSWAGRDWREAVI